MTLPDSPDEFPSLHDAGVAHQRTSRLNEAIACYRSAIAQDGGRGETFNNLAIALKRLGMAADALGAFEVASELLPQSAQIANNIGNILAELGRTGDAIDAYEKALRLRPEHADTLSNLAGALRDAGRVEEALGCYERAMVAQPGHAASESGRLYAMHFLPRCDAHTLFTAHREWAARHADPLMVEAASHPNRRDAGRRIRVGYVSPNFCEHSVGRFLLALFVHHDASAVEVFAYSDVLRPDAMTDHLRSRMNAWRDCVGVSDEALAKMIRADQIDVLVDLNMHMAESRLLTFARRPAPVQVTYLAYCSTTGMRAMDYRLTDAYLDPEETTSYAEKSVRLARSYWCYSRPGDAEVLPKDGGRGITFGCLNNFCKVSAEALRAWCEILRRVAGSRLILHAHEGAHRQRVRELFLSEGLEPARVELQRFMALQEYLRSYGRIDVALDPFPYAGGTTTCDALWMGVPVVSLAGVTAVSRGGLSILSNVGLAELVAHSAGEYIEKAVGLAMDMPRRGALRAGLRERMLASPLMDGPAFARDMEAAYRAMWRRWCEAGSA